MWAAGVILQTLYEEWFTMHKLIYELTLINYTCNSPNIPLRIYSSIQFSWIYFAGKAPLFAGMKYS